MELGKNLKSTIGTTFFQSKLIMWLSVDICYDEIHALGFLQPLEFHMRYL